MSNRSYLSIARLRKSSLEKHAPDTCRRNVLCRPAVATRDSTRLDSDDSPRPDARRWPATSRQKGSLGYSRLETRPSACARNPRHRPGLACARRRSAGERRRRQVPARARSAHGSRGYEKICDVRRESKLLFSADGVARMNTFSENGNNFVGRLLHEVGFSR